ncbi:mas-related G-protein coupled receptor member X1-like [Corvus hawaiiensis]|uniref:mas-related G-protein coupled receptor member X1-like n=1 Tax=Corvus hawaiiensis TaxID=134902 RepID=UPI002018447E|nr:mas-related G-protein coupled receptor member X1-like [Corvus hawaiiensis]
MEVSSVSPPSASPTEGADLCEIDVTNVAIGAVTLLISLCGLAGNGAVLWLLGFRIPRSPITIYILNLAVADFAFLLFAVPFAVLYLLEDVSCSMIMPLTYRSLLFPLSVLSYIVGLYLLTAISIERCRSILCPLRCRCHRPQCLSVVVCALLWALSTSLMASVISVCQSHKPEHCWVARICMYALNSLFIPAMVISSIILFIKVKCGSQQQQHKRLDIVVSLTVLVFALLALPPTLWNFLRKFGYSIMSSELVFLLTCIHSTINPFIYSLAGRCWKPCSVGSLRLSLQRVFEETEENTARSNHTAMDTLLC